MDDRDSDPGSTDKVSIWTEMDAKVMKNIYQFRFNNAKTVRG